MMDVQEKDEKINLNKSKRWALYYGLLAVQQVFKWNERQMHLCPVRMKVKPIVRVPFEDATRVVELEGTWRETFFLATCTLSQGTHGWGLETPVTVETRKEGVVQQIHEIAPSSLRDCLDFSFDD